MSERFSSSQKVDADRDFPALAAAISALPSVEPAGSALAAAAELRALLALQRRLAAAVLDRLASFDAQGFALASGSASTAAWVRAYTNATAPAATSLVAAARTTRTLPLLAAELTAGRIGVEHLQAVARSTQQVPDDVLAQHDKTLRDTAPHVTPAHLHRAGAKITEVWEAEAAAENVHHAEDTRRLSISQTLHGVWALDGTLAPEAGAKLAAALQPLIRKRGPEDDRTPTQRRADALLELVELALRSGQLPDAGGDRTRITLVVHATETALDLLEHHPDARREDSSNQTGRDGQDDAQHDHRNDGDTGSDRDDNAYSTDRGYPDGDADVAGDAQAAADTDDLAVGHLDVDDLDVDDLDVDDLVAGGASSRSIPDRGPLRDGWPPDGTPPRRPPTCSTSGSPPQQPTPRLLLPGLVVADPSAPGLQLPDGATPAGLELPHGSSTPGPRPDGPTPSCLLLPDGSPPAGLVPRPRSADGSTVPAPHNARSRDRGPSLRSGLHSGMHSGLRSGPGAWLAGGRLAAVFGDGASHRQLLGSHAELTIEALTRLGCDADLALAIMDATGQPLYLSRTSRDPNTTQRRLLVIRDGGCVFPGCDKPPAYCQAHHLKFWSHDGPTDIDNLALVCGFHHWLVHDKHWTLQALPASVDAPAGGWQAESPDGLTLTTHRQPAA